MAIYIEKTAGSFIQWQGERLETGELLPLSIEQSWSDADLATFKLYKPLPADAVPSGKTVTKTEVKRVSGKVKFVNTLIDTPPVPVPVEVTMRQAKIALHRHGYLTPSNQAIAAIPAPQGDEVRIEWEYAATLRRDHPTVGALGQVLNLSSTQIDDLFREAATV